MYRYQNLYDAMTESGMTLADAAASLHVSEPRLSAWLRGEAPIPFRAVMAARRLFPGRSLTHLFTESPLR